MIFPPHLHKRFFSSLSLSPLVFINLQSSFRSILIFSFLFLDFLLVSLPPTHLHFLLFPLFHSHELSLMTDDLSRYGFAFFSPSLSYIIRSHYLIPNIIPSCLFVFISLPFHFNDDGNVYFLFLFSLFLSRSLSCYFSSSEHEMEALPPSLSSSFTLFLPVFTTSS